MTPEQQKALALARARRRRKEADGWSPEKEADLAEKITGTGTFADMTGSGIAKAIPFGDEIVSGVNAPFRAAREFVQGEGFDLGRAYDRNMQVEEELQQRRSRRSPIASTFGAVAGGLGAATPLMKGGVSFLQGAKPTLGSLAGRGAAEGAAYGAVYGAGEGQGLKERAYNAAVGGGLGAATGGATGAASRLGVRGVTKQSTPSLDDLRAAATTAYQKADQAGVVFTPNAVNKVAKDVVGKLSDIGFDPALQPGAAAVVKRLRDLNGQNVTLKGLDTLRKVASNGFIPGNRSNNKAISSIIEAIDDVIANPGQGGVLMGNQQAGASALKTARELWSRVSKAERLSDAVSRAELRAGSTGSGGNVDNAIRQNVRRLVEKPRGFNKAEKEALEKIVTGTPGQNALRLAGKLSPSGNGLMAALGIGGTMVNPAIGALSLGGMGAKTAADALTKNSVSLADALIRSGGATAKQSLTPIQQAIIEALVGSGARALPSNISR